MTGGPRRAAEVLFRAEPPSQPQSRLQQLSRGLHAMSVWASADPLAVPSSKRAGSPLARASQAPCLLLLSLHLCSCLPICWPVCAGSFCISVPPALATEKHDQALGLEE